MHRETAMKRDVSKLATRAGRMVGTKGHDDARDYLVGRMEALGLRPYGERFGMPYRDNGTQFCNVMGVAPGATPNLPPLVLGAHYDTCGPLPGADDNAAAVAIAVEVGRRLLDSPASRDVVIALFDAEEPPHFNGTTMGSVEWYTRQRRGPVHGAVVLDLVGHDVPVEGLEDLLFVMGMESDAGLESIACAPTRGLRAQPLLNEYVGPMSDHYIFEKNKRPYLFVSCGRWEHYHMASDTPDKLSWPKIAAVTDYTEACVRSMCAAALDSGYGAYDTTATEAAHFRANFSSVFGFASTVRTRDQINLLVQSAMQMLQL